MEQLFTIKKVAIGPKNLEAEVELAAGAPLMTSDDPEGTARVTELLPELADHVCLGDASERFGGVAEHTELAHLLEHVSVEILARTNVAGDVVAGQTVAAGARTWRITLPCPDDVLVAGAVSSAAWILQWAYTGGGEPTPDVDAIASGLVDLVDSLSAADEPVEGGDEEPVAEPGDELEDEAAPMVEPEPEDAPEPEPEDAPAPEPEPAPESAAPVPAEPPAEEPALVEEEPATAEPEPAPAPAEPASEPAPAADESPAQEPPAAADEDAGGEEPDDGAESAKLWDMSSVPRPHLVR